MPPPCGISGSFENATSYRRAMRIVVLLVAATLTVGLTGCKGSDSSSVCATTTPVGADCPDTESNGG